MALIRPVTPEEQEIANLLYGKNMEDLTIGERTKLRKKIASGTIDTITFEQYLEDYKGMANDPDYKPKYVKANVGTGMSAQQLRARAEAKKTIQGFETKFNKNVSRRKRIKMKAALEADPERKQIEMAKKAERRRGRRVAKLADKKTLSPNEKLLNFEQSLITRQLNDKIKANPNIIFNNKKLIDQLSTTVDRDGNIIKSKPTIYEIEKRGLFEIEHQRDVSKAGAMKDFPYNRNLILGPHNRSGGFKDMAEKFIEKNPDPNNLKVKNIIEKANELKITLQPEVPQGTFKTKGIGYKQPADATGKFVEYAKFNLPELVDDRIGLKGFSGDTKMLETGLGLKQGTIVDSFVEKVKSVPGGCRAVVKKALGGPIDTCEAIIKADPEKAALKLNNAITATKGPLKELKEESIKLANLIDTGQITTADNLPRPDNAKLADTFNETNLRWNNDIGAIVETNNPDFAVKNVTEDLKLYADENPIPVDIDTKPPKTSPTVLKTIGKTLTKVGAPLPTALIDSYFVGQQVKDGKSTAEIAQDPMNWIGLAAMEPLSKVSGIAESGKLNSALRLGLNPATIRGISRFAGLPGLAVSTAMTAYDQYKKYQNEEGFIYNLFNKEEK